MNNWSRVVLVTNLTVRKLCSRPYPNHRKGCPNFNKRETCPPHAPLITDILNQRFPVWAIWNIFDFKAHCQRMRDLHPEWSQRQVECCLYWQGTARKRLRNHIRLFKVHHSELIIVRCPEANGVDLTATMQQIGQNLEWPPKSKTYQIVLAGMPK